MIYIGIIYTSLYFRCLCISFLIISRFSFFSSSHCSFSLNCIKENRERESRWILSPITNTHSYLLIEKKDLRHGLCLCSIFYFFLGIPHIQGSSPQTPHPYDYAPFWIDSRLGFIATFILKTIVNRQASFSSKHIHFHRAPRTFGTSGGQAVL